MLIPRSCSFISINYVHIGQPYDLLHVDLFNSIFQKSNNEKITLTKDDLTLFIDNKSLI